MSEHHHLLRDALERLSHPDQLVRLTLTQDILECWPVHDILQLLSSGLSDTRPRVQREAARLVGQLWCRRAELRDKLPDFTRPLCALITARCAVGRVQKAAGWSLGWLGSSQTTPAIAHLLLHSNPMYRRVAVESAGRIGGAGARAILLTGLKDISWQVRMDAAIGLGGANERDTSDEGPTNTEALINALEQEQDVKVAEQILRSLPETARDKSEAEHACEVLLRYLDDPISPTSLRQASARGLGELGFQDLAQARLLARDAAGDTSAVLNQLHWSARSGAVPGHTANGVTTSKQGIRQEAPDRDDGTY